ncbi:MAG: phage minor head protein [Pseudomonadota bacterium]
MTDAEFRALAGKQDRDIAGLENRGIRAGTRLTTGILGRILGAYRDGTTATVTLRPAIQVWKDELTGALMLGHLLGIEAVWRDVLADFETVQLSAYETALRVQRQRLGLTAEQIEGLRATYDANAVRVLHTVEMNVERKLQQTMTSAIQQGLPVRDGVKVLRQQFAAQGIDPRNSFQVEAIFRTQMQLAYSAGREAAYASQEIDEILWGFRYATVKDDRVRPNHAALEGFTAKKDDPAWLTITPPGGWACRCKKIPLTRPVRGKTKSADVLAAGTDKGFGFNPRFLFPVDPVPMAIPRAYTSGMVRRGMRLAIQGAATAAAPSLATLPRGWSVAMRKTPAGKKFPVYVSPEGKTFWTLDAAENAAGVRAAPVQRVGKKTRKSSTLRDIERTARAITRAPRGST